MSTMTNRTNLTLTIVSLTSIYLVTKHISKYGFTGSIRLIWEGDHLPPEIRVAVEALDNLEKIAIPKQERKLEKIDCMIQLAKLNSVDNDDDDIKKFGEDTVINETIDTNATTNTNNSIRSTGFSSATVSSSSSEIQRHYIVSQTPQITNELSSLSYNLDNLAARVDEVLSHGDADLKRRKKELSTKLVGMMEKVDGFISECGVVVHPS